MAYGSIMARVWLGLRVCALVVLSRCVRLYAVNSLQALMVSTVRGISKPVGRCTGLMSRPICSLEGVQRHGFGKTCTTDEYSRGSLVRDPGFMWSSGARMNIAASLMWSG